MTTAMPPDAQKARPSKADLIHLDRPEKLDNVLKEDTFDDCLSCKLIGATTLIGLGAYSYFSGKHHLQIREAAIMQSRSRFGMKSRQTGVTTIAISFVGMGLWRLLN